MSRLACSKPSARCASSSTIHEAKPIALSTVRPPSSRRFRRSASLPPPSTYSPSFPSQGSTASYPALAAISISWAASRFWPRMVLMLSPKRKRAGSRGEPSAFASGAAAAPTARVPPARKPRRETGGLFIPRLGVAVKKRGNRIAGPFKLKDGSGRNAQCEQDSLSQSPQSSHSQLSGQAPSQSHDSQVLQVPQSLLAPVVAHEATTSAKPERKRNSIFFIMRNPTLRNIHHEASYISDCRPSRPEVPEALVAAGASGLTPGPMIPLPSPAEALLSFRLIDPAAANVSRLRRIRRELVPALSSLNPDL